MLVLVPLANVVNLAMDGWGYICRLSLHWTLGLRTSLNQYHGVPTVSTNVMEFQQSQPHINVLEFQQSQPMSWSSNSLNLTAMSWSSNSLNQCPGVPTVSTNVLEFQQSQPISWSSNSLNQCPGVPTVSTAQQYPRVPS